MLINEILSDKSISMKKKYIKTVTIWLHFIIIFCFKSFAANETLATGAFIINMGITPQTLNNGLKPYGLVYDLLKNKLVPVKWVINSTKLKDSADFTYAGVKYKGGPFIVPAEYRTAAVNTVINTWIAAGVVGTTTTTPITVEVYLTLRFAPYWTLDKDKGNLVTPFFVNAGIPPSAHGGASSSGWKLPSQLNTCDDVFVLPHSDPTWTTHQNLYYWNQNFKGNIWSACHGVSVLESITNPGATIKMNFLSTTGLLLDGAHKDGTPPYNYQYPTDQVMQFMGSFDGATTNGSEQIYLPRPGSAWRPNTKLLVYDPTQEDVPVKSPGPAAVAIYGRAYNDTTRGFVMYEGGHDLNSGTVPERVAAQRAFFNYSFYSSNVKASIPISMANIPGVVRHGDTINIDFDLPAGYNQANYRKKWTSSCGGTFRPSDTIKLTRFIVPANPLITSCVITVTLTDACGRVNFASKQILIVAGILENSWGNLTGVLKNNNVYLQWNTETENNLYKFIVERSTDGISFTPVGDIAAKGNSTTKSIYNFVDYNVLTQDYYYRIQVVDKQNITAYSNTVFIGDKNKTTSFKISPNPVTVASTIIFYADKEYKISVSCFDITGKQTGKLNCTINKGETRVDFAEMKKLVPGMYIMKVQQDAETFYRKFIVTQ